MQVYDQIGHSNAGPPIHRVECGVPIFLLGHEIFRRFFIERNFEADKIERDEIIQTLKLHSSQVSFSNVTDIATQF